MECIKKRIQINGRQQLQLLFFLLLQITKENISIYIVLYSYLSYICSQNTFTDFCNTYCSSMLSIAKEKIATIVLLTL
ncbi:hypothetical protein D3C87_41550 [compost metagenome]